MTLFEYYIQYLEQLCEGAMTPPQGITLTEADPMKRAVQLQTQISEMGIPAFVRLCAEADGTQIPQQTYDEFDPNALLAALKAMPQAPAAEPPQEPVQEPAPKQNAYEAFVDCLCLDDKLLDYLVEVLKTKDNLAFFRLSQVTVRRELTLEDFLYWFGTKELYADEQERACVTIMDACFTRLAQENELQLLAVLLCGDKTTFELFRCAAPELRQLPDATFAWFEKYYLDRYYPLRFMLKHRGVKFPEFHPEGKK